MRSGLNLIEVSLSKPQGQPKEGCSLSSPSCPSRMVQHLSFLIVRSRLNDQRYFVDTKLSYNTAVKRLCISERCNDRIPVLE